ncbi:MAG: rhodanese-like domain-containing protein [Prosthecobacter sp.]|uniref:rhodanese-like domain-containing protein n=1 Tax=Prosthecobacter sp. TaxID=1965333 RepID=UPI0025CDE7EC|nr:rhodanese-like domain-containing protein [Prosthecobacter sp.]MCF7786547.1 rhodanese-like domain-containing protein [Prosthecobacter sp.]
MFSALRQATFLILLAATAAWATHAWHPRAPALYLVEEPLRNDEVSMQVIQERWQGKVLWIDARIQEQYDEAHIPGAVLLNEQYFEEQLFGLLDTLQTNTKPIILYCNAAKCDASRKILERLKQTLPIENAFVLKGGWNAWRQAAKKE